MKLFYQYLLAEEMNNRQLFLLWENTKGDKKAKLNCLVKEVTQYFRIDAALMPDVTSEIENYLHNICKYFSQLWKRHNRTFVKVLEKNADYFEKQFCLLQHILNNFPSSSNATHKSIKPFSETSDCVKRRRTAELRSAHNADELTYAAMMSLRSSK